MSDWGASSDFGSDWGSSSTDFGSDWGSSSTDFGSCDLSSDWGGYSSDMSSLYSESISSQSSSSSAFSSWGMGDWFVGVEADLVGIVGIEFGAGIVIDTENWADSGVYWTAGPAVGANVGIGFGGGLSMKLKVGPIMSTQIYGLFLQP